MAGDGCGISQMYEYKCLVLPDAVQEVTAGGIVLPDTTKDRKKWETVEATFVMAGALAFTDPDWGIMPNKGDRILIAKQAGYTWKGKDGLDYRIINDKDIVAELEEQGT